MIKITLNQTTGWKGNVYPKGEHFVPDDLARALGHAVTPAIDVESEEVAENHISLPQSDEPVESDPELTAIAARIEELRLTYFGESGDEANWRPIQELGRKYGIEKPEDGWDESFEVIANYEAENGLLPATD